MARNRFSARFKWLSALPLLAVTAVLLVLAVSTLSDAQSRSGGARERLFDFYARISPAATSGPSTFHIVEIDRESAEKVGPWPWPRSLVAELVTTAAEVGATSVVFIEPVDAPDPLSPETMGAFWLDGARDAELAAQLSLLPKTDVELARAFERTSGTISAKGASIFAPGADPVFGRGDVESADWVSIEGDSGGYVALPANSMRYDVDASLRTAARLSMTTIIPDSDGVIRTIPSAWTTNGAVLPTTALSAALSTTTDTATFVASHERLTAFGPTIASFNINSVRFPTDELGRFRLYLPRDISLPTTSSWRLLEPGASNAQLRGKTVIIGLSAELGGKLTTARGAMTQAELTALAAQQLVNGDALSRPAWTGYVEALLVLLFGVAAIIWSQKLTFWKSVGVAAAVAALLLTSSMIAFSVSELLFNPLPGVLALFVGALSVAGGRSIGTVLKDDTIRTGFHGALPEPTMKKLREDGVADILDGARREVTVLACELRLLDDDIERLSDRPERIVDLVASACATLRKSITELGGAVDQAEGGKVFAYFNAPLENADHVRTACSAALRLIESMDKINTELESAANLRNVQLHLAIGVATGDCVVGPMGRGKSNRYSAVGEAIEVASFLRRQAEFYGPAIICDEAIYRKTHHHFAYLELDKLRVRDEERSFSIYALVGNPFIKSSRGYRSLEEDHRELLTAFRAGDFMKARTHLQKARLSPGAKIALFDIYEQRIKKYAEKGAPDGWDGSIDVTL